MSSPTELVTYLDGHPWQHTSPPHSMAPRAWLLGVIAVQLTAGRSHIEAQLRASLTGGEAHTTLLQDGSIVHVSLGRVARPNVLAPDALGMACYLDGRLIDLIALTPELAGAHPKARAFGHVFCRWLRDGGVEPGFDLTGFQSLALGVKYERLVNRVLAPGQIVSYALRLR